jgi:hypothetical protein
MFSLEWAEKEEEEEREVRIRAGAANSARQMIININRAGRQAGRQAEWQAGRQG